LFKKELSLTVFLLFTACSSGSSNNRVTDITTMAQIPSTIINDINISTI